MTRAQADALAAELEAASELARGLAREFSPRELGEPPVPDGWSAADNLMHLTLSSEALIPRMTRTLGKLAESGRRSDGPTPSDWVGRVYARFLEPPVRLRVKAPRPFVPASGKTAAEALPAFLAAQRAVVALVDQSVGLDLAARKVPSPFSRYVQYNIYSAFRIFTAHERRHLWQARRAALAVRDRAAAS